MTPICPAAPNDVTQIISSSLYNVTLVGVGEYVRVTFLSGRTTGDIVTITRNTPEDRDNLYTNTNFTPSMLNGDFARQILMLQERQMFNTQLTPRYNTSATLDVPLDIILPLLGASETWRKNSGNTAFEAYELPDSGIAPAGATYLTLTDETTDLANSVDLSALGSGFMVNNAGTAILVRTNTGTAGQIGVTNGNGVSGNPTYYIVDDPIIPGTAGMGIPQGTTVERVTPVTGIGLRYNTDLAQIEFYAGGSWNQVEDSTDIATLLAMLASHTAVKVAPTPAGTIGINIPCKVCCG